MSTHWVLVFASAVFFHGGGDDGIGVAHTGSVFDSQAGCESDLAAQFDEVERRAGEAAESLSRDQQFGAACIEVRLPRVRTELPHAWDSNSELARNLLFGVRATKPSPLLEDAK